MFHKSWEEIDAPNWRKEEGDDSYGDTIEAFLFIYSQFVRGWGSLFFVLSGRSESDTGGTGEIL